jgi:hypothetical protein
MIQIGDFSESPTPINLDDTEALKNAISKLSVWISTKMAGVKWSSSKTGSEQFNDFAEFLSILEMTINFILADLIYISTSLMQKVLILGS